MPTEMTAKLLKSHKVRIAKAMARQVQSLVARYRNVDQTVLEKNLATLMDAGYLLFSAGDESRLMMVMQHIMQIRSLGGFQTSEFLLACMSFLPVMRRLLFEKLPVAQALAEYEAVETVALPFFGRFVSLFEEAQAQWQEDATPVDLARRFGPMGSVAVEAVVGDDDVELTVWDGPVVTRWTS